MDQGSNTMAVLREPSALGAAAVVAPDPRAEPDEARPERSGPIHHLRQRGLAIVLHLTTHPGHLFLALLALNALGLPYANLTHDARLYGLQVLNRLEDGRFADDLFFRYGSQDRYSLFSPMAVPLVRALGLPLSFFILYLLSNSLFLLALQRLVRALIPDGWVATVALLVLAMTPIPFGGLSIFHVNENFFTPRILANALVLFGLEQLLHGRPFSCLGLLVPALGLHPLMAFGGVLVVLAWLLVTYVPRRWLAGLAGLAGILAIAVLLQEPLGIRIFGYMDDTWREWIGLVTPYNFPAEWSAEDWLRVLGSFLVGLGALAYLGRGRPRQLVALVLVVGLLGLVGTIVASRLPYALLFQGQPYRAIWLVQLLEIPLGLFLVVHWWQRGSSGGRAAALALAAFLAAPSLDMIRPALLFLPACVLFWRGLAAKPKRPDWLWRAVGCSVLLGIMGWTAGKLLVLLLYWNAQAAGVHGVVGQRLLHMAIEPWTQWLLGALFLVLLYRFLGSVRYVVITAGTFLLVQTTLFGLAQASSFRADLREHWEDVQFLQSILAARSGGAMRPPTVYWAVGQVEYLWFDLGVPSYFENTQVVGSMFSRGTATEGWRRFDLVEPFERDCYRCRGIFWNTPLEAVDTEPTRADLLRLAGDEGLDWIVVRQEFDDLYTATNGRWFVYDGRHIRAAAKAAAP